MFVKLFPFTSSSSYISNALLYEIVLPSKFTVKIKFKKKLFPHQKLYEHLFMIFLFYFTGLVIVVVVVVSTTTLTTTIMKLHIFMRLQKVVILILGKFSKLLHEAC